MTAAVGLDFAHLHRGVLRFSTKRVRLTFSMRISHGDYNVLEECHVKQISMNCGAIFEKASLSVPSGLES